MYISSDQIRAARALLRLEQAELARRAKVSVITIRRLEATHGAAPGALAGVCQVLEQAGAEFIEGGVRRRNSTRPEAARLFSDLRAISLQGAAQLQGHDMLTDSDLYDDSGLPG